MSQLEWSIDNRIGFHPSYTIHLPAAENTKGCPWRIQLALPSAVYLDPYELADQTYSLELESTPNLELPAVALRTHNFTVTLTVQARPGDIVTVPFHARYGQPSLHDRTASRVINMPGPYAVPVCSAAGSTHRPPSPHHHAEHVGVQIPVGVLRDLDSVEAGTSVVMWVMFLYLISVFRSTASRLFKPSNAKME